MAPRFQEAYAFYAAYHTNHVNQLIHCVFVPIIFWSAMVMLAPVQLPDLGFGQPVHPLLPFNVSLVITALYVLYYLSLTVPLGSLAGALVVLLLLTANAFYNSFHANGVSWRVALAAHVFAWAFQFYGHDVHEGRKPALLDGLLQSLFMAPLFITIELLTMAGFLKEFQKSVAPLVNANRKEYNVALKAGGRTAA